APRPAEPNYPHHQTQPPAPASPPKTPPRCRRISADKVTSQVPHLDVISAALTVPGRATRLRGKMAQSHPETSLAKAGQADASADQDADQHQGDMTGTERPIRARRSTLAARIVALVTATALAGASVPAQAQRGPPVIRDAEIEQLLREYTQPLLKAAGLAQQNVQAGIIH